MKGYPLSQTLFTSVHIDRLLWPEPKKLEDASFIRDRPHELLSLSHQILRAYCILLIKACDLVLAMVTSQHYYEVRPFFHLLHQSLTRYRKKTLPLSSSIVICYIVLLARISVRLVRRRLKHSKNRISITISSKQSMFALTSAWMCLRCSCTMLMVDLRLSLCSRFFTST